MAKIALTTNVAPPAAVDLWLDDVSGINEDTPSVVEVRVTARSNNASGRQPYAGFTLQVRDGIAATPGDPNAVPPVSPTPASGESVGITRGPVSYHQGIIEKRAVIPNAMTNLINAWFGAGNAAGQNANQRKEARKQAALTQLLADGVIDATLTGTVS